jgi:UDP-N-acetylglucosamine acyltransferase
MFLIEDEVDLKKFSGVAHVHPTAHIAKGAEIGKGVVVGPHACIGPQVVLSDGVHIGANAIIEGKTFVGDDTKISSFATIGVKPQDLKYQGENTELIIGKRNDIREYANISIGTDTGIGKTEIGDDNLIMVYSHVAHDCIIGNHVILANSVQVAGHVEIGDHAVIGGMCGIHQFSRIGMLAMVGAASVVVQDVAPYCMVQGDRAVLVGLNGVGLRRQGIKDARLSQLRDIYNVVFKENLTVRDAIRKMDELPDSPERSEMITFLEGSDRGICR